MILDTDDIKIYYDDQSELVAIYLRGDYLCSGKMYEVLQEFASKLAVPINYTDSFLRGGDCDDSCADTVREIEEWERGATDRREQAEELERQASELMQRASRLRGDR